MKYWALRWLSYPLVLGGASAAILWVVSHGLPYWPLVPTLVLLGIGCVAVLERWQPHETAWLHDHGTRAPTRCTFL